MKEKYKSIEDLFGEESLKDYIKDNYYNNYRNKYSLIFHSIFSLSRCECNIKRWVSTSRQVKNSTVSVDQSTLCVGSQCSIDTF